MEQPAREIAASESGSSSSAGVEWAAAFLTLLFLLGAYATEISDTDFWWHLKTGEFIVTEGSLPVPDPFSYTSSEGEPAYPGEERVRRFNLTHEWLSQAVLHRIWSIGGFPALTAWKALLLAFVSGAAGWLAWRRTSSMTAGVAATLIGYPIMQSFAADRPALATFAFVAAFTLLLDRFRERGDRRALYALPVLALIWANSHGGFFMGWIVAGAYAAAAWNDEPAKRRPLWIACAASVLLSGLNPNGFNVIPVLIDYQKSYLTETLIEWKRPALWGRPYILQALIYLTAGVMIWRRARVRAVDWLLFIVFTAAGFAAFRNAAFVAFFAPVFLLTYGWPPLARKYPALDSTPGVGGAAALAAALLTWKVFAGAGFQGHVARWKFPIGAAELIAKQAPGARIWNTYEYGGYLIWALGPEQKTFIDGRALNESVYREYLRMLRARPEDLRLFDQYDVDLVVMNSFEYVSGVLYPLVTALGDPRETGWELVYQDAQALVFARAGQQNRELIAEHKLDKSAVYEHLDAACETYVANDPTLPACFKTLGLLYAQRGEREKAYAALRIYRSLWPDPDPTVEQAMASLAQR